MKKLKTMGRWGGLLLVPLAALALGQTQVEAAEEPETFAVDEEEMLAALEAVPGADTGEDRKASRVAAIEDQARPGSMDPTTRREADTTEESPATAEVAFTFDEETQTITGYEGEETEITVPKTIRNIPVKAIGNKAFLKKNLTQVALAPGIEHIGQQAFAANKNLAQVQFGEGLISIGKGAFVQSSLKEIRLPETVKELGELAFANIKSLEEVHLNEGLEKIGDRAFYRDEGLKDELTLPASVAYLGGSAFSGTGLKTLNIKGDAKSPQLEMASGFSDSITELNFASPTRRADIPYNSSNKGEVHVNLGILNSQAQSVEELAQELKAKLNVHYVARYEADQKGEAPFILRKELAWPLETVDFSKSEVTLTAEPRFTEEEAGDKPGYKTPNCVTCGIHTFFHLTVNLTGQGTEEGSAEEWTAADFTFAPFRFKGRMEVAVEKFGISGLTEQGQEKLKKTGVLVLPGEVTIRENGQEVKKVVEGVATKAFEEYAFPIKKLVLPALPRGYQFIVNPSAFRAVGLEELKVSESTTVIDSGAFMDNHLTTVSLPWRVWKVGNSAFRNNHIKHLEFSDGMSGLQLDNYSFANNELSTVKLPYSIFKFLEYVFRDNPGADQSGVVRLETRNPKHLDASTYIHPSSYHDIILTAPGRERDGLYALLEEGYELEASHYRTEDFKAFAQVFQKAKQVFADSEASQAALDDEAQALAEALATLRASAPNKTPLLDILRVVEQLDERLFTQESWQKLADVMAEAQAALVQDDISDEQLQKLTADLKAAEGDLVISDRALYELQDFTYEGTTLTGFSESGREKFAYNKVVRLPDKNADGAWFTAIADQAFKMADKDVEIGSDVVNSPQGMREVVLPKYLEELGDQAFEYQSLADVVFPASLKKIGQLAFRGNRLEKLNLPDQVETVGASAFALNLLTEVHLSKRLTELANGLFSRNIYLDHIDLHEGLEKIGQGAFVGAPLTALELPSTITEIGRLAFNSHRLSHLHIPHTIKKIGADAFKQNVKFRTLKEVTFEEGLEELGENAFRSGLLQEVILPRSLKKIGRKTFSDNMNAAKEIITVKLLISNPEQKIWDTARYQGQELVFSEALAQVDKSRLGKLLAALAEESELSREQEEILAQVRQVYYAAGSTVEDVKASEAALVALEKALADQGTGEEEDDGEETPNPDDETPATDPEASEEVTEKPGEETEQPGQDVEAPEEETEEAGQGTEGPGQDVEAPEEETEEPGQGTEEPGQDVEDPEQETEKPEQGSEEPSQNVEEPEQDMEEPSSGETEPGAGGVSSSEKPNENIETEKVGDGNAAAEALRPAAEKKGAAAGASPSKKTGEQLPQTGSRPSHSLLALPLLALGISVFSYRPQRRQV